jgi:hypothetical protein
MASEAGGLILQGFQRFLEGEARLLRTPNKRLRICSTAICDVSSASMAVHRLERPSFAALAEGKSFNSASQPRQLVSQPAT